MFMLNKLFESESESLNLLMQLRITIAMCMVEIRNRKTLQSKVNICKSDVKIGDYADSLGNSLKFMSSDFKTRL